ncbi:MAG: 23S rRNA (pseudouridine(1915)-N(3))-methyltransferase RlmH [Pseudomonadales bacterium]
MKIKILALGTRMPSWVQEGCNDYCQRIRPMQQLELVEIPLAKRGKTSDISRVKAEEAGAIGKQLKGNEKLVVLDVRGKSFSTPDLAGFIESWQMDGRDVAIIIGGPDGLDERFLSTAYARLSLSKLTLPHPLARMVLIEQIYRALAINANHPYHRE